MKKLIAATLAVSLTMGLMATAIFAVEDGSMRTSTGTIEFTTDDDEGITDPDKPPTFPPVVPDPEEPPIIDPDNPPVEDDDADEEDGTFQSVMDLDFGERDLEFERRVYQSLNRAGLGVRAYADDPWTVTVEIDEFKINGVQTLKGFELTLAPTAIFTMVEDQEIEAKTVKIWAPSHKDGSTSAAIATGKKGTVGANFRGYLDVAAGTADEGKAQAVITWNWSYDLP